MKIKDIFKINGISVITKGNGIYLTDDNCKIIKVSVFDDRIDLILKDESYNIEGFISIYIKEEYKNNEKELLLLTAENNLIKGLTLGELREFEIDAKSIIK